MRDFRSLFFLFLGTWSNLQPLILSNQEWILIIDDFNPKLLVKKYVRFGTRLNAVEHFNRQTTSNFNINMISKPC